MVIPSITIEELMEEARKNLALVSIYDFRELFAIDPNTTPEEVWRQIVHRSLAEFVRHFPFYYVQRIMFNNDVIYTFVDNLHLYVSGTLDPLYVTLVPDVVVSVSTHPMPQAKSSAIKFDYRNPNLFLYAPLNGLFYVKTLCKYPVYQDTVYFLNRSSQEFDIYRKFLTLDVGLYILYLKKNYALSNLPIELFGGLEELVQAIRDELSRMIEALPRNYLIMY